MKKLHIYYLISMLLLGVFFVGCGQNTTQKTEKPQELEATSLTSSQKETLKESEQEEKLIRKKIIRSDSTYAIEFYDEIGNLISTYDIWENNPFDLPDFQKYDETPGHHPMRYKIQNLTKMKLKGKIPDELFKSLPERVHFGRFDLFVHYPYKIETGEHYTPVLYQLNAMEGYDEEYEIPASFGVINILDNKGKIWKSIEVPDSGGRMPAVTQDGKYLVYKKVFPNKKTGGCFEVNDLSHDEIVFNKCTDKNYELNVFHVDSNTVGAIAFNRLEKKTDLFYVKSNSEKIFTKTINANLEGQYGFINTTNGVLITFIPTNETNTLIFTKDFITQNLRK